MTQVTKAIDEEYVVSIDLGTYTDLIETDYKYRMLRDTIIKSMEYCNWKSCKMEIDADKVAPILNAIEPVAYNSIFSQLKKQYDESRNKTKVSEAVVEEIVEG